MRMEKGSAVTVGEILEVKETKEQRHRGICSTLFELAVATAIVILITFVIFGFAAVDGNSMFPALRDGDFVILYCMDKSYQSGEVIAFNLNNTQYVKRIVAVSGDVVSIDDESGRLIVNGNVLNDDSLFPTRSLGEIVQFPYTVPENSVFVLGDNREHSADSRVFSAIPLEHVRGKVLLVLRTKIV